MSNSTITLAEIPSTLEAELVLIYRKCYQTGNMIPRDMKLKGRLGFTKTPRFGATFI